MEVADQKKDSLGVLLIAQGKKRYLKMAINLVKSIWINHGKLPVAVVTDIHLDNNQKKYFDFVIPIRDEFGKGFSQKMRMYQYSPFEQTLFIDADCLVIRSFQFILDGFRNKSVAVLGHKIVKGPYIGTTVENIKQFYPKINEFPMFNGGVYYFEKSSEAKEVFDFANFIFNDRYFEMGLHLFNGKPGDEPAMAIAMAKYNCFVLEDNGIGMFTPVGISGTISIDVLKKKCYFTKHNKLVNPSIMHFGGGYPEAFHYRRELAKINFYLTTHLPKPIVSASINFFYNSSYAIYVFFYRTLKFILKRKRMKLLPILPMFKFE